MGDTIGYKISFTGRGSSGSVGVSDTDTNSYTLSSLKSGDMYYISIFGISEHFFSDSVEWETALMVAGEGVYQPFWLVIWHKPTGQTGGEKSHEEEG